MKAPPPPPVFTAVPVAFSWTGFYVGVEGGADFMNTRGAVNNAATGTTAVYGAHATGGAFGGMVGYNQQIGSLVVGVEANGAGVVGGKRAVAGTDALGNVYNVRPTHTYDADLRGRIGFAMDRALIYAAGGVAFGDVGANVSGAVAPTSFTSNRAGWTVGGGVEYAFTNNIIGRAEYRYANLGSVNYANAATGVSDKIKYDSNSAMLGLMYKFGSPSAP
jgi:outer membrane immunogenic protein